MSEFRLTTVEKRRNLHEETNRAARLQIEAERVARDEKTARLRKLREAGAKAASK